MTDTAKPPLIQPGNPSTSDLKLYRLPGTVIVDDRGEFPLCIRFQNGAMELGRNGATTEEVLDVLIEHINYFQKGPFACRENALIITKLEEAKHWALHRKQLREAQEVKGREAAHVG